MITAHSGHLIHLSAYVELLRDETSEVDLAGPTLPILKALCDRGFSPKYGGKLELLPKVVNGMLSASLQNVEDMRCVVLSDNNAQNSSSTDVPTVFLEADKEFQLRSR